MFTRTTAAVADLGGPQRADRHQMLAVKIAVEPTVIVRIQREHLSRECGQVNRRVNVHERHIGAIVVVRDRNGCGGERRPMMKQSPVGYTSARHSLMASSRISTD